MLLRSVALLDTQTHNSACFVSQTQRTKSPALETDPQRCVQMLFSHRKPTLLSVLAAAAAAATGAVLLAAPAQASGLALGGQVVPGVVQEVVGDFQVDELEDELTLGNAARSLLCSKGSCAPNSLFQACVCPGELNDSRETICICLCMDTLILTSFSQILVVLLTHVAQHLPITLPKL